MSSRIIIVANTMHMRCHEEKAIDSDLLTLKLGIDTDFGIKIMCSFCFVFGNGPDLQSVVSASSKMGFKEIISNSNTDDNTRGN